MTNRPTSTNTRTISSSRSAYCPINFGKSYVRRLLSVLSLIELHKGPRSRLVVQGLIKIGTSEEIRRLRNEQRNARTDSGNRVHS